MPILLDILLFLLAFGIALVFITQVLVPFRQGTRFFPWFKKPTELTTKIQQAREELEETTEFVALQKQLKDINKQKENLTK